MSSKDKEIQRLREVIKQKDENLKDLEKWIKHFDFKCPNCGESGLGCCGMQG